ncbi:S41 family peptidase [Chitinophaga sp. MD30]|uniref:S41 family peptidase n=1 Tax=Chitinophaga sp. MD30 TaxID=2033437 RepID=UPI0012FD0D59|nr:S41 family peptidase [Chitinophaga sp. MD30]
MYFYAKELYLWNNQLPTQQQFNPRQYLGDGTSEMDQVKKTLFVLSQFAINPVTSQPYERHPSQTGVAKYSTVLDYLQSGGTPVAVNTLKGAGESFGLGLVAIGSNDIRIQYAIRGSSADNAGVRRGLRVTKVNSRPVSTTESYYDFVQSAFQNSAVELMIKDEDSGTERLATLYQSNYSADPVHKDSIFRLGQRNIGYFSFHYFSPASNARTALSPIFQRFINAQITDLIIDLRYNGGGYLNTCKYIANVIGPAASDRRVMFSEHYNAVMQRGESPLLAKQYIYDGNNQPVMLGDRLATLADIDFSVASNTTFFDHEYGLHQLRKIYFIVSDKTASAAELLINVLKPYMPVTLIGVSSAGNTPVRTYGKPVGFFDIRIDHYKVYMSMFQDKNANNEGDYFDGMPTDISRPDDARYNFGDTRDPALRAAIDAIAPGALPRIASQERLSSTDNNFHVKEIPVSAPMFNGLIKDNWRFLK